MNTERVSGLHHVTAIAGDAQANLDFYAGVLGLRLVKRTVNFDDPATYHFYFGDESGSPGTILTFFPWTGVARGTIGAGQVTATALAIPAPALDYWRTRLAEHRIVTHASRRFGEDVLALEDPDGLRLELIAVVLDADERETVAPRDLAPAWNDGPVPVEHALRGFHSVTLTPAGPLARSLAPLEGVMGFERVAAAAERTRLRGAGPGAGTLVDVIDAPATPSGRMGAGTVHHVAWRAADDAAQLAWRARLAEAGLAPTEVLDRQYFHSIYFREPGHILFEIATDSPGFGWDESAQELGMHLKLPPWLERNRVEIEAALPNVMLPAVRRDAS